MNVGSGMLVIAIQIDALDGYVIHGYPRKGTGKHHNDYVKIVKGSIRGKFRLDKEEWQDYIDLDASAKIKITAHLKANKEHLREKIRGLG